VAGFVAIDSLGRKLAQEPPFACWLCAPRTTLVAARHRTVLHLRFGNRWPRQQRKTTWSAINTSIGGILIRNIMGKLSEWRTCRGAGTSNDALSLLSIGRSQVWRLQRRNKTPLRLSPCHGAHLSLPFGRTQMFSIPSPVHEAPSELSITKHLNAIMRGTKMRSISFPSGSIASWPLMSNHPPISHFGVTCANWLITMMLARQKALRAFQTHRED